MDLRRMEAAWSQRRALSRAREGRQAAATSRFRAATGRSGNSRDFSDLPAVGGAAAASSPGGSGAVRQHRDADGRLLLPLGPDLDHPRPRGPAGAAGLSRADPVAPPHPLLRAASDLVGAAAAHGGAELVGQLRTRRPPRAGMDLRSVRDDPAPDHPALHDGRDRASRHSGGRADRPARPLLSRIPGLLRHLDRLDPLEPVPRLQ